MLPISMQNNATGQAIDACEGLVAFCVTEEGVCALKKGDEVEGDNDDNETASGSGTVVPPPPPTTAGGDPPAAPPPRPRRPRKMSKTPR